MTQTLKTLAELGRLRSVPMGTAAVLKDVFVRCVADAPNPVEARRMFVTACVHNPDLRAQLLTDEEATARANQRATFEFDELARARDGAAKTEPAKLGRNPLAPSQKFDAGARPRAPAQTGHKARVPSVEPKPSEGAMAQAPAQSGRMSAAPSFRPQSASDIKAAGHFAHQIARTVLDSFRVRDGRSIGDITVGEVERLRASNAREAAVLRQIQRHIGNLGQLDQSTQLRELLNHEVVERFVQRAAEWDDAA